MQRPILAALVAATLTACDHHPDHPHHEHAEHAPAGADPAAVLAAEHEVVGWVVEAAEQEAREIESSKQVDPERVGDMIEFFTGFTDACHHAKEEHHLFPALRDRDPQAAVLVERLAAQHLEGRARLARLREALTAAAAGDAEAAPRVAEALAEHARALRAHLDLEEAQLLPAIAHLDPEAQAEVAAAFERVEREETGAGVHERYHTLALRLSGRSHAH